MRKAAGIALVCVGVIGFVLCGIVFFHLSLSASEWFRHVHTLGVLLDPIEGPLFSMASLLIGVYLLRGEGQRPA